MRDYQVRRNGRGIVRALTVTETERRGLLGCVVRSRRGRAWGVYDEESRRIGEGATIIESLGVLLRASRRCDECARPLARDAPDCLGCARDFAMAEAPGA